MLLQKETAETEPKDCNAIAKVEITVLARAVYDCLTLTVAAHSFVIA